MDRFNKKDLKCIVFCDKDNTDFNEQYAEELIKSFRSITKWKVEKDTVIWNDLRKWSLYYSKCKRDTLEVAYIFIIANNVDY